MIITLLTNCLNIYILGALKYAHYIKTCLTIKTVLNWCALLLSIQRNDRI